MMDPRRPDLLRHAVASGTLLSYRRAAHSFLVWAKKQRFFSNIHSASLDTLDDSLVAYSNHNFRIHHGSRGARQHCVNARSAIIHLFPRLRQSLFSSSRALYAWDRLVPGTQHPPCPKQLMYVLMDEFIKDGHLDLAIITALAFFGYLRISEASLIQRSWINSPEKGSILGFIWLPKSKTGLNQCAKIQSAAFWKLYQYYLDVQTAEDAVSVFLFPRRRPSTVSLHMSRLCQMLRVSYKITAHCLRHGGATDDFINGVPINEIQQKGRWRNAKSTTRYIQASRALLLTVDLPDEVKVKGDWIIQNPLRLLRQCQ